ncbi:MAG: TIGR01244 family protein [Alphaproteobacteria bacterium]|nr:MAG: TIGR01244 family protein [Alphaproteobacteria bacterium]
MARIIQLEPGVFVAPQLVAEDFAEIAARGFRSVVDNRPDGEAPGQMSHDEAAAASRRHGMRFRYDPVINANVTEDAPVAAFARAMAELPGPILFYCRTGTRCTMLWAQAVAGRLGAGEALRIAAGAGYNLEDLRPILEERAGLVEA